MSAAKPFPLGVVLLGAGASARMGRAKLLLPWRDTTVIGHLLAQWQALGIGQTAIVLRAADRALMAELDRLNFPQTHRIENPQPERGMFGSILCAASWPGWETNISRWAVVLGDQPHLRSETLRRLLAFSDEYRDAICHPEFGGRIGHPVILPRAAFAELGNSGAATLKEFLKLTAQPRVQCSVTDAGLSLDMDTPEDYKRLLSSHCA
jgi:molybdenum cofactor cytidylyltransferase